MEKKFIATFKDQEIPIQVESLSEDQLKIKSDKHEWIIDVHQAGPGHYSVIHQGKSYDLRFFYKDSAVQAFLHGEHLYFDLTDQASRLRVDRSKGEKTGELTVGPVQLRAQMPGKIVSVQVKPGDKVTIGQGIVIVEAMKMENEMISPKAGKVVDVHVKEGQSVESGAVMVVID